MPISIGTKHVVVTTVDTDQIAISTGTSTIKVLSSGGMVTIKDTPTADVIQIASQGVQGLKGDKGDTGSDATGFLSGMVAVPAATNALNVEQIDLSTAISTVWEIVAVDTVNGKKRRLTLSALITGDYHVYDIYGDKVPFRAFAQVFGVGTIRLAIVSHHTNPIDIHFNRHSVN